MNKIPTEVVDIIYNFVHKEYTKDLMIELKKIFNQVKYYSLLQIWGNRIKFCKNETIFYLLKDIEFTDCFLRYPKRIKRIQI